MRTWALVAILLVLLMVVLTAACATRASVVPIWFRNAPPDWTPPERFADCRVRDEVVLENGAPNGLPTIRLECPDRTVLLEKQSKRLVWQKYWNW